MYLVFIQNFPFKLAGDFIKLGWLCSKTGVKIIIKFLSRPINQLILVL